MCVRKDGGECRPWSKRKEGREGSDGSLGRPRNRARTSLLLQGRVSATQGIKRFIANGPTKGHHVDENERMFPARVITRSIAGWERRVGRLLSRILSGLPRMTISLGRPSPDASSDLPGGRGGPGRPARGPSPGPSAPLFGLAPDGVYLAGPVTRPAGELLPHRFTLTTALPPWRFAFCCTLPTRLPGRWVLPTIAPCGVRTFLRTRNHLARKRKWPAAAAISSAPTLSPDHHTDEEKTGPEVPTRPHLRPEGTNSLPERIYFSHFLQIEYNNREPPTRSEPR